MQETVSQLARGLVAFCRLRVPKKEFAKGLTDQKEDPRPGNPLEGWSETR
jgi:hypothetical protein